MTELATLFGVSRQTLYNWRNGEQPRADLIGKLAELARCADVVAAAGLKDTSRILTRKAIDGRSLFDVVKAGQRAAGFADRMVQLLRLEQEGRDELNARFRGRPRRNDLAEFHSPSNELP
jgi:transcriptional regulator with XRE-family HTH domain